jgi:hypothetical protein
MNRKTIIILSNILLKTAFILNCPNLEEILLKGGITILWKREDGNFEYYKVLSGPHYKYKKLGRVFVDLASIGFFVG